METFCRKRISPPYGRGLRPRRKWWGEASRRAALPCARLCAACACAACHRVADNAPTSLTLAHRHVSRCARPLDNRKIAFGSGRLAIRASASRPLGWAGALSATVGTSAPCAFRRPSIPPTRIRLASEVRHPSANAGLMARSGYLPSPCASASRRLPHLGGGFALATWQERRLACPLSAHARLIRRKRSRLRLPMSHTRAKRTDGTR